MNPFVHGVVNAGVRFRNVGFDGSVVGVLFDDWKCGVSGGTIDDEVFDTDAAMPFMPEYGFDGGYEFIARIATNSDDCQVK